MPVLIATTAQVAVIYNLAGTAELYRAPVSIYHEARGGEIVTFPAVTPPTGGGGIVSLDDLRAAGYRVEVTTLDPVPSTARAEATLGMYSATARAPEVHHGQHLQGCRACYEYNDKETGR